MSYQLPDVRKVIKKEGQPPQLPLPAYEKNQTKGFAVGVGIEPTCIPSRIQPSDQLPPYP